MTVKILYFARLREALGTAGEEFALPADVRDLAGLTRVLASRGGPWSAELAAGRAVRAAVNQDVAGADTRIADGDEVAFFPPVTGG